jgi:hypothetical protein
MHVQVNTDSSIAGNDELTREVETAVRDAAPRRPAANRRQPQGRDAFGGRGRRRREAEEDPREHPRAAERSLNFDGRAGKRQQPRGG